jgi:hypothetical protein
VNPSPLTRHQQGSVLLAHAMLGWVTRARPRHGSHRAV